MLSNHPNSNLFLKFSGTVEWQSTQIW